MKAYEQLYKMLYARLVHFSASIVGSFQSAEEIVSDVFIMLWRKKEQFVSVENPAVYLYICVRNFSLNALPQNKTSCIDFNTLDKDALSVMPDIEERLVSREVASVIEKAIRDLPGRCQMIFRLIKIDCLSYKETADLLGISPKTVDAQLSIAVKKLSLAIRLYTPEHLVNDYLKIPEKKY